MAKIDLLIPSYKSPQPAMLDATNKMLDYSQCKCGISSWETAKQLAEAHISGKKAKVHLSHNPFHHPSQCPLGKHDIHNAPRVSACVIQWSRNRLLTMRRPDCDYVCFIDDDIVIEEDYLDRLVSHGKDIIAGVCTRRLDPPEPTLRQWVDENQNYGVLLKWPDKEQLMRVDAVGTGFMLISREAIEDIALAYHPELYRNTGDGKWFEFLPGPYEAEWGEDISFCWKATRIDYEIWVDNTVRPKHIGDYCYGMDDYLSYRDERISGAVVKETEHM